MAKVERYRTPAGEIRWAFLCPGCGFEHALHVSGGKEGSPKWSFNGDVDFPTFSPSVLVRWDFSDQRPDRVCHSFVRGGRIEFLGDCTHDMAGRTVDLPDMKPD